ncbi:benzylsuccinate CoA-transferase BbsF subunit [Roseovarius pacificus]|uniref:Benzylsuccinate CoA-transferase BbsF subunit n=1 Tax=Roseovarius pacificus TaxID=337701 RepID=A0A1M7ACP9_9RHOB|nr:CoA transferase [Roseovarius pacificus]GGO53618.1 succinyl-CoA--D-citramalate CoA-transferase [Roseovarius pacificus]SHL40436.1 benzylsuccinate CoA-transferase BbsF subunit [Roseovarius pacificus]
MKPLAGLRIADFTVHAAGPFCTHMLSQMGAEVIKVETALRPDIFRKPHAVYGRQGPATFDQVSSNKLSVRLNLKHPDGVALAKKLVTIADVAAESFRAGVMARLGLGYEALHQAKPDIVMVSVSSSGQTGPESHFAGYAPLFGAWGGLGYLSGHADGPPVEMRHVMDHSVGMHAALATLAALHRRRRTGLGCHVDVAAREVASSLVGDALTAASASVTVGRMGNDDMTRAPHGLFPTADADRWLSIAVSGDEEWQKLAGIIGQPHLGHDPRYATQPCRHENRRDLDDPIAAWTGAQKGETTAELLQAAGIAAHLSWAASDIVSDPHMRARGSIIEVTETNGHLRAAVGRPARFAGDDAPGITRGTPALGGDEAYVYGELLGLSRARINALIDDKAIY